MVMVANLGLMVASGSSSASVLFAGNDAMALGIAICEVVSYILRPLSLAVRLFANMTSGVLLSGLLLPSAAASLVGAINAQDVSVSIISLLVYLVSTVVLSVLEIAVGVIQTYVFIALSELFSSFRVWYLFYIVFIYFVTVSGHFIILVLKM